MTNNEEVNIKEINRIHGEIKKYLEEIRPSVIEQVKNDPSLKDASEEEINAKIEEIMDNHERRYAQEHPRDIMKYFVYTRQRIKAIEEKALRRLATRRSPEGTSMSLEETNAKAAAFIEKIRKEQERRYIEHQGDCQKEHDAFEEAYNAYSRGDFEGLDDAQFTKKFWSFFNKTS